MERGRRATHYSSAAILISLLSSPLLSSPLLY
jgi:hypothetical protein